MDLITYGLCADYIDQNLKQPVDDAQTYASNAAKSETNAASYAASAASKAEEAATSEKNAATSEKNAAEYAEKIENVYSKEGGEITGDVQIDKNLTVTENTTVNNIIINGTINNDSIDTIVNGNIEVVGDIAVQGHSSPIGTVIEYTGDETWNSSEEGGLQTFGSITISKGTWIITANLQLEVKSANRFMFGIKDNADDTVFSTEYEGAITYYYEIINTYNRPNITKIVAINDETNTQDFVGYIGTMRWRLVKIKAVRIA